MAQETAVGGRKSTYTTRVHRFTHRRCPLRSLMSKRLGDLDQKSVGETGTADSHYSEDRVHSAKRRLQCQGRKSIHRLQCALRAKSKEPSIVSAWLFALSCWCNLWIVFYSEASSVTSTTSGFR